MITSSIRLSSVFILLQVIFFFVHTTTVSALPSGFRDDGVARIHGISTISFAPKREGGYLMYAAIKDGLVKVLSNPDNSGTSWTALDISSRVCFNGERGIHQVLAHPDFGGDMPYVYISYTHLDRSGGCGLSLNTGAVNRLSRFRVRDDYSINEDSEEVFLQTSPLSNKIHNGGDMLFGNDGYLYLTIGDGGSPRQAQDRSNILGTVVRLTEDGGIPPDNPFVGSDSARCNERAQPGSTCQEIFHYGFRNPYRFSMDPNSNSGTTQLYIGDVGGKTWEEISEGGTDQAGGNFGWNDREGPCRTNSYLDCPPPESGVIDPMFWYGHDGGGAAVTGVAAIPNGLWPSSYDGAILYLEFVQSELYVIHNDGTACDACDDGRPLPAWTKTLFHALADSNVGRAAQLIFGPYQGSEALYYTTRSGSQNVRRITFEGVSNQAPIARISSDTTSATIGDSISFDGTESHDPDGDTLDFSWDFGDGSTSTDATTKHQFDGPGTFDVVLTVTDGSTFTGTADLAVNIGSPPIPTIENLPPNTTFAVGDLITLVGSAVDGDGDIVPDTSLSWEVRQHHNTHYHPFLDPSSGNNIKMDPAPAPEDFLAATNSYLEVLLTATDSNGISATVNVLLMPQMVELFIDSDPPGLELVLDEYPITTPVLATSWVNHSLSMKAEDQQGMYFQSWSDGGHSNQVVTVGTEGRTYRAHYATCMPLWRVECSINNDCCSGVCRNGQCRAAPKLAKNKLDYGHGGTASGQTKDEGGQSGRIRRVRGA